MKIICSLLFACLCFSSDLFASTLVFVKIDGIPGESTITGHVNEIEALSFSISALQGGLTTFVGGAGSAAKSQFSPLTIFKEIDKTSPMLFINCALGKKIPTVTLILSDNSAPEAPPTDYFKIVLTNVVISSVNDNQAVNGELPLESVSFAYQKIQWTFTPKGGVSPVTGAFDILTNKQF